MGKQQKQRKILVSRQETKGYNINVVFHIIMTTTVTIDNGDCNLSHHKSFKKIPSDLPYRDTTSPYGPKERHQ